MKKIILIFTLITMMLFTACGNPIESEHNEDNEESIVKEVQEPEAVAIEESNQSEAQGTENPGDELESVNINIGALRGPTSIGLVKLMEQNENGAAANYYTFTMEATADTLLPMIVKGEMDIALVPANVAAILYQKTNGGISVIDINTLGVLYMVSSDTKIKGMKDLSGKKVYLTGKGTTPDYVLNYLLRANEVSDVELEYKSEAAEVAAILAEQPDAVGLLPQPYVTAACTQNEQLNVVLDMTEEWKNIQGEEGSSLVTGVTIVRKDFLENNAQAVEVFMEEHKQSTLYVNENVKDAARLVVKTGIIEKEPIAIKAIPECNITYLDGEAMKQALSGYLQILFEQSKEAVGGAVPADDFYYIP